MNIQTDKVYLSVLLGEYELGLDCSNPRGLVSFRGNRTFLTPTLMRLLARLMNEPGQLITLAVLQGLFGTENNIRVLMHELRLILDTLQPKLGACIVNKARRGYILVAQKVEEQRNL